MTGFAAPRVTRIRALLGDGATRSVATRPLPAAFGIARRVFAIVLGRDVAVRRLTAVGRSGRRLAGVQLDLAPRRLECSGARLASTSVGSARRPPAAATSSRPRR